MIQIQHYMVETI